MSRRQYIKYIIAVAVLLMGIGLILNIQPIATYLFEFQPRSDLGAISPPPNKVGEYLNFSSGWSLIYSVDLPSTEVIAFYQQELTTQGWLLSVSAPYNRTWCIAAESGTRKRIIEITEAGHTIVTVKYPDALTIC